MSDVQGFGVKSALRVWLAALVIGGGWTLPAAADLSEKMIVGWVEKVVIEPYGFLVKARVDTGANTSSMHAENVERFTRDDEDWVRFLLEVKLADQDDDDDFPSVVVERPVVRNIRIKQHDGGYDRRAVVEMRFCLGDRLHTEQFSLNDRSALNYPVLLGRRFLRDVALVDSANTFLVTPRCEKQETAGTDAAASASADSGARQ